MDGIFTFHHLAVILGTWASLSVPLMGWVTLNAVNAELGSFFYNIYDQYGRQSEQQPAKVGCWRVIYWVTMTISNTVAAVVAIVVLFDDSTDDAYKGIYVGVVGGASSALRHALHLAHRASRHRTGNSPERWCGDRLVRCLQGRQRHRRRR